MEKRLTESLYLTCEDFCHLDVVCCDTCHNFYPHYDMWIVVLSDGWHVWVCDTTKHILMHQGAAATPDEEQIYYCLQYSHHRYKGKRGNQTLRTPVSRALRLSDRGPAHSARIA